MGDCAKCGSPSVEGDIFCRQCGETLETEAENTVFPASPPDIDDEEDPSVEKLEAATARLNHKAPDSTQSPAHKPSAAGLVFYCILAVLAVALFFYIRSLATLPSLTSALEGGRTWYLKPGFALPVEAILVALVGLFLALAIRSGVRLVRNETASIVGEANTSEGDPDAARRLRNLASLRDQGLVSNDEYEAKRLEILTEV